jgi:hypothetical protein
VNHTCPSCGTETRYAAFSGGREWQCPGCDDSGFYPDDAPPIRAHLLRTEAGRVALRAEMDQEIARRRDEGRQSMKTPAWWWFLLPVGIAVWSGIGYVAWHFISKYW